MNKSIVFNIKGMNRDLSVSKFNPEYSYENKNLRLTPLGENTLGSLVNEKGNKLMDIEGLGNNIIGVPIGQAVLGNNLIIFTHNSIDSYYIPDINHAETANISIKAETANISDIEIERGDFIYKINFNEGIIKSELLYKGFLNFQYKYPIEAIANYENDAIQKIYWVDGINQPRYINIAADERTRSLWNDDSFNFASSSSSSSSEVTITRLNGGGYFSSGVIQYMFTYYTKNGKESSPFYISPLYYISLEDRGLDAESSSSNSFEIKISDVNDKEEYIRIYSILRTSIDSTPIAKIVNNIEINGNKEITFSDTGIYGEDVDYKLLLYLGSEDITASTLGIKDNTLFLGGITLNQKDITDSIKDKVRKLGIVYTNQGELGYPVSDPTETTYSYDSTLQYNSQQIRTFKYLEWYRFGLQFKHKSGKWSSPVFIRDARNTVSIGVPDIKSGTMKNKKIFPVIANLEDYTYTDSEGEHSIISDLYNELSELDYVAVRPIIVYPREEERESICQGILCPTLFNLKDRCDGEIYAIPSWFTRPFKPYDQGRTINDKSNVTITNYYPDTLNPVIFTYSNGDTNDPIIESNGEFSKRNVLANESRSTINLDSDRVFHDQNWFNIYTFNRVPYSKIAEEGSWLENTHLIGLPNNYNRNCEIQLTYNNLTWPVGNNTNNRNEDDALIDNYSDNFFVDQSIFTLHSPDIEFNDNIDKLISNAKLRIVGIVPITAFASDIDIEANSPSAYVDKAASDNSSSPTYSTKFAPGLVKSFDNVEVLNIAHDGGRCLCAYPFWRDEIYNYDAYFKNQANPNHYDTSFVVYPWHREGCLNNSDRTDAAAPSLLIKKTMSNLRYSYTNIYLNSNKIYYTEIEGDANKRGITGAYLFRSDSTDIIKLPSQSNGDDIVYMGNVDKVVYKSVNNNNGAYPINTSYVGPLRYTGNSIVGYSTNRVTKIGDPDIGYTRFQGDNVMQVAYPINTDYVFSKPETVKAKGFSTTNLGNQPVRISYKSTPHIVMSLRYTNNGKQITLPSIIDGDNSGSWYINSTFFKFNKEDSGSTHLLWDKNREITGTITDIIDLSYKFRSLDYGFLWLGELYRDDIQNRFGGTSSTAVEQNEWLICGDEISIENIGNIVWKEGDTYYQRYDHLKTYPYGEGYKNNIVDIVSFMCETRINIDGRYDRNRGLKDNTNINPNIFNQINPVYSQLNNFFTYRALSDLRNDKFLNLITWTQPKSNGQDIDPWLNISMLNTYDLDGALGPVNAIKFLNNSLIAFQDKGISEILYNTRTQLSTTEGVPVELGNSGKVNGVRYISNIIGCQNKWSICQSPNGLYFTDDISKSIYLFNNSITNLSDSKGFHSWVYSNSKEGIVWNPVDFNNMVTYYDNTTGDILFITNKECLAYNELFNEFTSFYSYEKTPYIFSLTDTTGAIRPFSSYKNIYESVYKLWKQHEGNYNDFYNVLQPYYINIIANPDPTSDKIFNNIEYRADCFYDDNTYWYDHMAFDRLEVKNEYQSNSVSLKFNRIGNSNVKKKFRTWNLLIPRDSKNNRDRMRNPWLNIMLTKNDVYAGIKTVIHDLIVHYFE
jgi:hypothetical protein